VGPALEILALVIAADGTLDLRVDLSQFVTDDSASDVNRIFTDLRLEAAATHLFTLEGLALHLDGRGRYAFDEHTERRYDVTRAYVQYGEDTSWSVGLGRIPILEIGTASVDGARAAIGLVDLAILSLYGGLIPHPITAAPNVDFYGGGAAYEIRHDVVRNAGGAHVQLYDGALDRVYASERIFLRFGSWLSIFANGIVDFVTPEGVDLTNLLGVVRVRPVDFIDFTISASHVHAILPNKWWQDWIEQERARLGFTLDGPLPVGTRRTNTRLVTNLHVLDFLTPYVSGRFDVRHEDGARGWEARGGVKAAQSDLGYVDLFGAYRDYFGAAHQIGGLQIGWDGYAYVGVDAGGSVLNVEDIGLLYDVNAAIYGNLGPVRLTAVYQVFIEPELVYQLFFFRAGYRFEG
jgi:hypothetical protein